MNIKKFFILMIATLISAGSFDMLKITTNFLNKSSLRRRVDFSNRLADRRIYLHNLRKLIHELESQKCNGRRKRFGAGKFRCDHQRY